MERVGRYQILEAVAEGGFGAVYRAVDDAGRVVALKLLHAELARDRAVVERFEREARLVALVRHANVVRVLDFGVEHQGQAYFVMEWLEGQDLRRLLAAQGRPAPARALALVRDVAAALDAAHAVGVVHRDVKASNVFVTAERALLVDFGVAKLLDDTRPGLTSSRHVIGTPPCMAPEQITGAPVDARTDVYGLGILAFHVLTGVLPFQHENAALVMDMHVSVPPPRASRLAPLAPAVDDVLAWALAKAPEARPATAGALARALAEAVAPMAPARADAPARATARVRFDLAEHVDPDAPEALDALEQARALIHAAAVAAGVELLRLSGNVAVLAHAEAARVCDAAQVVATRLRALAALRVVVQIP